MLLSKGANPSATFRRANRSFRGLAPSGAAVRLASTTVHAAPVKQAPFGNEYGAGPSRIPYRPRQAAGQAQAYSTECTIRGAGEAGEKTGLGSLRRSRIKDLQRAMMWLAKAKALPDTRYLNEVIRAAIPTLDPANLSRLELHIILHALARQSRTLLLAVHFLEQALLDLREQAKRGRWNRKSDGIRLSPNTLTYVFRNERPMQLEHQISQLDSEIPLHELPYDKTHTLKEQASVKPRRRLAALLKVLALLRDTRQPRPLGLYKELISGLVRQKMPDEAAKVYVGLVEEWITEGRLAHGAELVDVEGSGAPPADLRIRATREMKLGILSSWWKGIRSWALPGEVLSPHQRLDLWHPLHTSLGERLRNFPLPTPANPPLLVPSPSTVLLRLVLHGIILDAHGLPPARFAASMRACAILSNTVLTRMLPFLSKGELFDILARTPRDPPVYPDEMIVLPPEGDRWAYQAFTHVHLALQSVVWAPPIPLSGELLEHVERCRRALDDGKHPPDPPPEAYALPPLCRETCFVLIRYVMRRLREPAALRNLLTYMRDKLHSTAARQEKYFTSLFNTLFRESRIMRNDSLAFEAESKLFENTALSPSSFLNWQRSYIEQIKVAHPQAAVELTADLDRTPKLPTTYEPLLADFEPAEPDHLSVVQLITLLGATGQRDRLRYSTRTLIPFLAFNKRTPPAELERYFLHRRRKPSPSGRPGPSPLAIPVYNALLGALAKVGDIYTAEKVWAIVRYNEWRARRSWKIQQQAAGTSEPFPNYKCIPIEAFTNMMKVYSNAATAVAKRLDKRRANAQSRWPRNLRLPWDAARQPRAEAASYMVWRTYIRAARHWRSAMSANKGRAGHAAPDRIFFQQFIDSRQHLWADMVEFDRDPRAVPTRIMQLKRVARDMKQFKIPIPPAVYRALGWAMGKWQQDQAWGVARRAGYEGTREQWDYENVRDLPVWDPEEQRLKTPALEEAGWDEWSRVARRQWTLRIRNNRSLNMFRGKTAEERRGGRSTRAELFGIKPQELPSTGTKVPRERQHDRIVASTA